jgi:hypothetical protein
MQEPTRPDFGEGRSEWNGTSGQVSIRPAGVLATACGQRGPYATQEVPAGIAVRINWQLVRDRPGRLGWRRGSQYRGSRVTPVEGRGFSWRRTQEATTEREIGDKPDNSRVVFRSCRRRHRQWPRRLYESSPRAGCGKSARPVR